MHIIASPVCNLATGAGLRSGLTTKPSFGCYCLLVNGKQMAMPW